MVRVTSGLPPLRSAEIIAVGTEMLGSTRVDTNSLYLADQLASLGISLHAKSVVGDRREDLAAVFRGALARADFVVLTGGLGPTDDDLTREVVAGVLGRTLREDPAIVERLQTRFAKRGLRMPDVNRRQAMVPDGATVLDNPNGTAPGLWLEDGPRAIVLLPGPPREVKPMFERLVQGPLGTRVGAERFVRAVLFITGRGESHVEEIIQPIYAPWAAAVPPIETTILAAPGQIEVHLAMRSSDRAQAEAAVFALRDRIAGAVGADVFSTDGRFMEEVVGDRLRELGLTIAVAESCSGGLLLSRLTDVPGSSEYVLGGVVAYSNDVKTASLGVPPDLIAEHGAVSEPVAVAMARGVRERLGSAIGVGVTGIAGPGGGSDRKPVGTVAVAAVTADDTFVRTFLFPGGRAQVKHHASQAGLDMVRRMIAGHASVRRS